jgi:hypothetical protein
VVFLQEGLVDPWFIIKPLQLGGAHQPAKILISLHVFGQQYQMGKTLVIQGRFIGQSARGDITFTSDYRFDTGFGGLLIELDGPEHSAVIGQRNGFHSEISGPLKQVVDTDSSIQKTVLGVNV